MHNFDKLFEDIQKSKTITMAEALSAADHKRISKEIQSSDLLPCTFDCNVRGWMARIKLWGKILIKHKDPENFSGKKKVTIDQMLKFIEDDELRKMMSHWNWDRKGLTKCVMFKDYIGKNGRVYTTAFFIKVKLCKELR